MKTLKVELGDRSYPIYIGAGLLSNADLITNHINSHQVLIVSNETVAPLYLKELQKHLAEFETKTIILPDGEQYKTLEVLNTIFDTLIANHFDRQCTLIALGGGVVGDITGFAAACYQRGVHIIQIPTTLLAQVDSSVGGKTGVNHPQGKNMIGAFYQPQCVIADTSSLDTLDDRQLAAGLAEVIKYGLIRDADFFTWLENHLSELLARSPDSLTCAIEKSCINKAEIVAEDEKESGQRALLNLGHTFGHAIETAMGYGSWLHGEAVAAGMCIAADMSQQHGWIEANDLERIKTIIAMAGLPTLPPASLFPQQLLDIMAIDKKSMHGHLRLVLLKSIGCAILTDSFKVSILENSISKHLHKE